MLKLYDCLEAVMEEQKNRQWYFETKLTFFASDIMETLKIKDFQEMNSALTRVFHACETLNIPFNNNFMRVFRADDENIIADWKISPLACYLIIINCDPRYENVAKAQLFFAMNQNTHQ